jgi:hypothetical protein
MLGVADRPGSYTAQNHCTIDTRAVPTKYESVDRPVIAAVAAAGRFNDAAASTTAATATAVEQAGE